MSISLDSIKRAQEAARGRAQGLRQAIARKAQTAKGAMRKWGR